MSVKIKGRLLEKFAFIVFVYKEVKWGILIVQASMKFMIAWIDG